MNADTLVCSLEIPSQTTKRRQWKQYLCMQNRIQLTGGSLLGVRRRISLCSDSDQGNCHQGCIHIRIFPGVAHSTCFHFIWELPCNAILFLTMAPGAPLLSRSNEKSSLPAGRAYMWKSYLWTMWGGIDLAPPWKWWWSALVFSPPSF